MSYSDKHLTEARYITVIALAQLGGGGGGDCLTRPVSHCSMPAGLILACEIFMGPPVSPPVVFPQGCSPSPEESFTPLWVAFLFSLSKYQGLHLFPCSPPSSKPEQKRAMGWTLFPSASSQVSGCDFFSKRGTPRIVIVPLL